MTHTTHDKHAHIHSEHCGHTAIEHNGHLDYLHDGHLHSSHEGHYDEHVLEVNTNNPATCAPVECACGHQDCGHKSIPHGDHVDYLYEGTLHHVHGDHCDNHGAVKVKQQ